jgi:hypothetical protein
VIACDAVTVPVVTGSPDLAIVDKIIAIVVAYLDTNGDGDGSRGGATAGAGHGTPDMASHGGQATPGHSADGHSDAATAGWGTATARSQPLSPGAWQALRYAIARLAVDLVSGPDRLASILRRGLLDAPYTSKSAILDIGYSQTIPGHIRRAVKLRARGTCEWPRCARPAVYCDVHHLRHQANDGETFIRNCVLLCQYHHDICIHRKGWRLVLHPDATTTAYGPHGQVIHSHGPPPAGPLGAESRGTGPPR